MDKQRRSGLISGITLIAIGLVLFWLEQVENIGQSVIFFVIGSLFLGAYLYGKNFGLLIPGCLMLGLGVGTTLERMKLVDEPGKVGLGIGFIAIFAIPLIYERRSHWWPLVPGSVLLLSAFSLGEELMKFLFSGGWPLVLVVIGIVVLLGSFTNRAARKGAD